MTQELDKLFTEKAAFNYEDLLQRVKYLERLIQGGNVADTNLNLYGNDAGGRLRVSQLTTQGSYRYLHGDNALFFDEEIIGTATSTYTSSKKGMVMTTSATSDAVIRQSKQWHNYQDGKSQYTEWTFDDMNPQTNITKRSGYFSSNTSTPWDSDKDGIYLESDDTTVKLIVSKAGSVVYTGDDLVSKGIDFTKFTIVIVDFLWLGGSAVRLWMVQDGKIVLEDIYKHAGNVSDVMMESPNQPIRYEIRQTGSGSGTFTAICSQVASEGATNEIGIPIGIDNAVTTVAATTAGTIYNLKAFRLQSARRNIVTDLQSITVKNTSNNRDFRVILLLNPTIATGSLSFSDVTNTSIQEASGGATFTAGTGHVIFTAYSGDSIPIALAVTSALRVGSTLGLTMDFISLAVQGVTNNQTFVGGINILEFT